MKPRLVSISLICVLAGIAAHGESLLKTARSGAAPTLVLPSVLSKDAEYPPVALRGYGTVSGTAWSAIAPFSGSVLEISCEDESKAALLHAKYLSDLRLLPGVTDIRLGNDASTCAALIGDQGAIAAFRTGACVSILAASDAGQLKTLLENGTTIDPRTAFSEPEVEVPMYLDRWDKFGFRFYYRAWELPENTAAADYKFMDEFRYAAGKGRLGFVFWARPNTNDAAQGIDQHPFWDWGLYAAAERQLPVGINITGGTGYGSSAQMSMDRFREQTMMKMPDFSGNYRKVGDPTNGAQGALSWSATTARDWEYGLLQETVRQTSRLPNVVSYLEPSGEVKHGQHDFFLEYGPFADATFRRYLLKKYTTLEILNEKWRSAFASWQDVRVPEVASFLGWETDGNRAIDLAGTWRIGYEPSVAGQNTEAPGWSQITMGSSLVPTKGAPDEWFAENFDDSAWPQVRAPGDDIVMLLPKRPAVYRRDIDVSEDWLSAPANRRVWLYIWDLNLAHRDHLAVALNGELTGRAGYASSVPQFNHWGALEVTGKLKAGRNQITLRLPKGFLGYKVYLSSIPPQTYPSSDMAWNARWADFHDWMIQTRIDTLRRGMEMIRAVDKERQIVLMAPDSALDGIKKLALGYGGNFHNTGWMGTVWGDMLPAVMRGARLPFSLEPGEPARDRTGFRQLVGRYSTEGLQGIDYFIHIGSVLWNPEIKAQFEEDLPVLKLLGKYHGPAARVAALYSDRSAGLTSWPWGAGNPVSNKAPDINIGSGYWSWNIRANLQGVFESDALTESSFFASANEEADADRYSVIIDTSTAIMDEPLVSAIERYVRAGGTFVTFGQTGRHTSTQANAWPIARLTGFRVTGIDSRKPGTDEKTFRSLTPAPGQDVFVDDWSAMPANGLTLQPVVPDAKPLMLWPDGSTAIGMRSLGQGLVVQVGCKFSSDGIPDRIEPAASTHRPFRNTTQSQNDALTRLLTRLLEWRGVPRLPYRLEPAQDSIIVRHFVSNNGLHNVWMLWNRNPAESFDIQLVLPGNPTVGTAFDVKAGRNLPVSGNRIRMVLRPLETRGFLTPRHAITNAASSWFALQRSWWRGTTPAPKEATLPAPDEAISRNLGRDWAFRPLQAGEDGAAFSGIGIDDKDWERMRFGIWTPLGHSGVKHAVFRKTFTIPAAWNDGEISLWIMSIWSGHTFRDQARVWLDGKLIRDWSPNGLEGFLSPGVMLPGSEHTLAVEIRGRGDVAGAAGAPWLAYAPNPAGTIDLSGEWIPTQDALHPASPVTLPGTVTAFTLRRTVQLPEDLAGKGVSLRVDADGPLAGIIVNGRLVRRFHHNIGKRWTLDLTPWVRPRSANTLELFAWGGAGRLSIRALTLDIHEKTITRPDHE
ncbi:hypothetical protein OPIT5_09695 [Opitutaceae bacterium TAV5]|nr:hypothetical protein OPIT5_09695 [Opitutaceae bacterium TAV5]